MVKSQNVKIVKSLNAFNPELELKDAEFAMGNKLIHLLSELRGFTIDRFFLIYNAIIYSF